MKKNLITGSFMLLTMGVFAQNDSTKVPPPTDSTKVPTDTTTKKHPKKKTTPPTASTSYQTHINSSTDNGNVNTTLQSAVAVIPSKIKREGKIAATTTV